MPPILAMVGRRSALDDCGGEGFATLRTRQPTDAPLTGAMSG